MRYILLLVLVGLAGLAAWLAFGPSPIAPLAWEPPANPGLTGPYIPNEALKGATLAKVTPGVGPEDVTLGPDGFLYTGLADGSIVKLKADGSTPPVLVAKTGGRPLGLEFASVGPLAGQLIVADALRGLISVDADGAITVLAIKAGGKPIAFADDLAIAADGTVYFSDASARGYDFVPVDLWEGSTTGRLLAYDPATGETRVVLDGLRFANGVAMGPDDAFVLVNETMAYRVTRVWLKGPKAGERDVFIDGLPGFPDNLSFDGKGRFWIALVQPREDFLDGLAGRPLLRRMVFNLFSLTGFPESGSRYGWVIGVDVEGRVVANLQDPAGTVHNVTSVNRFGDTLVLGSLAMDAVATVPAPVGPSY